MRKPFLLFTVVISAVLVACGAVLAQARPPGGQEPERYIVVLDDGVSDPGRAADAMARRYGLGVGFVYGHALKGFSATIPEARLEAVRSVGRGQDRRRPELRGGRGRHRFGRRRQRLRPR